MIEEGGLAVGQSANELAHLTSGSERIRCGYQFVIVHGASIYPLSFYTHGSAAAVATEVPVSFHADGNPKNDCSYRVILPPRPPSLSAEGASSEAVAMPVGLEG